ncbi:MAG: hypothetical protein HYZ85_00915 [Candidatus Omnitrophica bacterium]|nr:hypothetical protein [Candidatus Omnitrophota bacterium]
MSIRPVYEVSPKSDIALKECVKSFKNEIKHLNPFVRDPDFEGEIPHDDSCFFLQSSEAFLAAKVFYGEEDKVSLHQFMREVDQRMIYFFSTIQFLIFIPRGVWGDTQVLKTQDRRLHYIEYEILKGEAGQALSLRELRCPNASACFLKEKPVPTTFSAQTPRLSTGYPYYQQGRLSHDELSDLIQLSIDLQR